MTFISLSHLYTNTNQGTQLLVTNFFGVLNNFLNILFPEECPMCKRQSTDHVTAPICTECWQGILPYQGPGCQKCGRPLVSDYAIVCEECIVDEPSFKRAASYGLYEGTLKKAINLLKYYGIKRLSHPLSDFLLHSGIPKVDAVIPVPLHEKRLRHREFNQSALIANHIAKRAGVSLILDCLIKAKDTAHQVGLHSKERRRNIKNAFKIKNHHLIKGKKILLIDDVITTGATIRECSRVLAKAGAGDIYVMTLAHGIMD